MMDVTKLNIETSVNDVLRAYKESFSDMPFLSEAKLRLESLKVRIHSNQVRVAVIGITSSGKSTLLNAILGERLLPARVAPSSGKQVLCGYGENFRADIIFEEETGKDTLIILNDVQKIQAVLDQYGDEKLNPGNMHKVSEIHVYSPAFKFNHDLVFVDTPGLDAYGLGIHEEITLKMVLPTVDMILFLTNVKCDSDQQNLDFIDRVTSDVKPLVVVQNKIDSIEPKITKNGVEKTKEDIRKEHYHRLEKLLALAKKKSVKSAPIVQISAKASTWENKNLDSLSTVLDQLVSINSAHRYSRFKIQFLREIESMESILSKTLKEVSKKEAEYAAQKEILKNWESHIAEIKSSLNRINGEIAHKIENVSQLCNALLTSIEDEYSQKDIFGKKVTGYRNPESLSRTVLNRKKIFESVIAQTSSVFNDSIAEIQRLIAVSCNDLNLQESQVSRKEIFGQLNVSISNCQKVVKGEYHKATTIRVPRDTVGGGIKRFFGSFFGQDDWGYDEEEVPAYRDPDTTTHDIAALINEIKKGYTQFKAFFSQKYPVFQKNSEFSINFIEQNFFAKKKEIDDIFQTVLPFKTAENVLSTLHKYIQPQGGAAAADSTPVANVKRAEQTDIISENYQIREISKLSYDLFDYAQYHALDVHRALVKSLIQESRLHDVYIAGWDRERASVLKYLFFPDDAKINFLDFSIKTFLFQIQKHCSFFWSMRNNPGV